MSGISDGVSKVWIQRFENRAMQLDGFVDDYDATMALVRRIATRDEKNGLPKLQSMIDAYRETLRLDEEREANGEVDNEEGAS